MSINSAPDSFPLVGRYAERNRLDIINGPGDSRVTGSQIIYDEGIVDAWHDKAVLITGVSSGIGIETVKAIALTGATVFGTARNLAKAKEALGSVLDNERIHLLFMDQTDLSSVRACAQEFREHSSTLNVIINNTGVMNTPEYRTKDGFEMQFGTNHLSHFLLFYLLKDLLLASSTPEFHSRVVNVSSAGHQRSPVRLDNVNFDGIYNGWLAYASSKTANIHMTNQIERLYGSRGLHGYSLHPGCFVSPNLQKFSQKEMDTVTEDEVMRRMLTNLEQACATSVYGAVSKEIEGKGGLYLEGASVAAKPARRGGKIGIDYGYAPFAYDKDKEEALWELSKTLAGVE